MGGKAHCSLIEGRGLEMNQKKRKRYKTLWRQTSGKEKSSVCKLLHECYLSGRFWERKGERWRFLKNKGLLCLPADPALWREKRSRVPGFQKLPKSPG